MNNVIEFFCYENDNPISIQLEPEAVIFIASPGSSLRFIAVNCHNDFKWSIRREHANKGIQLFPDSLNQYKIEVYKNDKLLEDW